MNYEDDIDAEKEAAQKLANTVTPDNIEPAYFNSGWLCPRCGGVNAPHMSRCPCVPLPPPQITYSCTN